MERARADCEASLVARMTLAAQRGNWHAAAWLLERAYPERWAPRNRSVPLLADAGEEPLDALDAPSPPRPT